LEKNLSEKKEKKKKKKKKKNEEKEMQKLSKTRRILQQPYLSLPDFCKISRQKKLHCAKNPFCAKWSS
jgi:hypothetical protein